MGVKKAVRTKKPARAATSKSQKKDASAKWWTEMPAWFTETPGAPVAAAFVAIVAVLAISYPSARPSGPAGKERVAPVTAEREAVDDTSMAIAPEPSAEPVMDTTREDAPAFVTITGCLERADDQFRLTETAGANAPKARSWKSAFLAKRSAPVTVVGAARDLGLPRHVGERVTVTGTLVDREMRVRSLRRVSASCDPAPRVKA